VALVTGSLAALRALRHHRAPTRPATELALIGRRARIALLAGFGTLAGLVLYLVDFAATFPAWYLGLVGGLSAAAAVPMLTAYRSVAHAQAIVTTSPGAAGDAYDDVPLIGWSRLRDHPWRFGLIVSLIVGLVVTLFTGHAERSLQEGLERGLVEGVVCGMGFLLLGQSVGLVASRRPGELSGGPDARLASDLDRFHAERVLREGFARGQISLDELTARLSYVYEAETVGQMREALAGLSPDA
jgi:hypothetical protein